MGKMVRNLVTVKDEGKGADMKRYVSISLLSMGRC
jgi:hypothetical protein